MPGVCCLLKHPAKAEVLLLLGGEAHELMNVCEVADFVPVEVERRACVCCTPSRFPLQRRDSCKHP